jgi:hypothetical protein
MSTLPSYQAGSTIELTEAAAWADNGQPVDLTAASVIEFEVFPPAGTLLHWAAAAVGPPTAGVMAYTSSPTDCLLGGIWQAQAHIVTAGGLTYRTDPRLMQWRVVANLPGV